MGRSLGKSPSERLQRLISAYGCESAGLVGLAMAMGLPYGTVANWHKRGSVPEKWLHRAAAATGFPADWLLNGGSDPLPAGGSDQTGRTGLQVKKSAPSAHLGGRVEQPSQAPYIVRTDATHARGGSAARRPSSTTNEADASDADLPVLPVQNKAGKQLGEMQVIPRFELHSAAGRGGALQKEQANIAADMVGVLAMDREFMRQNLGHDGEGFASLRVSGDFMAPTLQEGDVIIFDTLIDRVNVTGVYVLRTGDDLEVVRIHRKRDGTLVLKGDNAKYEPEVLSPASARELKVMGRMMWPKAR